MKNKKEDSSCCNLEAIVSFDERGQMVFPKDVRKRFQLKAGDKFALVSCTPDEKGQICCCTLIKTDQLEDKIKDALQPVFGQIMCSTC